mmetsp:Transcript_4052/g.4625  ORF Transcript_4052/g.4625 Transcript_4052/m.4625 type:complete len:129 (-) Transcript_4052:459-845(-)|eukprot:CAMPEP_0197854066 /NCGR_PEP_ID=MMETSP1438-20131217/23987_1 /TAXON_ID=1461541 /ORGANISM="Pterosperma sp., Strain CCMP1384" /LENGTH=128 /DNA_ID=CAMNT_0043468701 /DNA_START=93 /DNA_END=479 /DNA_ORIENTATION=+
MEAVMDEKTQSEFFELQQKMMENASKLKSVNASQKNKQSDIKRSELTVQELSEMSDDTVTYKTVGRAFMYVPKLELQKEIEDHAKELAAEIESLQSQEQYLRKQEKESENNMKEFIQGNPALKAQFTR